MDFFIQSMLQPNSQNDFLKDIIYIQSFSNDNYNDLRQKDPFTQYERQALNRKYDRVDTFLVKNAINLKKNTKRHKKEQGYSINPYQNRNLYSGKMIDQIQNVLPAQVHPTQIQKSFEDHEFDYKLHNLLRSGMDIFKVDEVKRRRIVKKPSTILKPCQCCGKQSHHRHKCLHIFCDKKCGKVRSRSRVAHPTQSRQDFNSQSYDEDQSDYQLQYSKTRKHQSQQEQSSGKYQIFQPSQALIKSIDQLLVQPYDLDFSYKIIQIREFVQQKQISNSNNSNNQEQNIDFNKYNVVQRDKISQVQSKSQVSESRRNNSIKQVLKSVYSNSEPQVSNQPHFNQIQVVQKGGEEQPKNQRNGNAKNQNQTKQKQQIKSKNSNYIKRKSKKSTNNQMSQNSSSDQEKKNPKINQVQKLQQSDKENQSSKAKQQISKNQKQSAEQEQQQDQDQLSYDSDFKKLLAAKSRGGDLQIIEGEFQCGNELQKLYMRNRLSSQISVRQQEDGQLINYYEDQLSKLLNDNSQLKKRQRFQSQQLVEYDILNQQDYKEQQKLKIIQNQQKKPNSQELLKQTQQYSLKGLGRGKGAGMGSGLGIFENQLFMDEEEHHNDQQFNMLISRYSSTGSRESKNKQRSQISKKRNQKLEKLAIKQIQKKQNLNEIKEKLKHLQQEQKLLYQNHMGLGHGKGFGMGHGMGMAYEQQLQMQIQLQKQEKAQSSQNDQDQQKE